MMARPINKSNPVNRFILEASPIPCVGAARRVPTVVFGVPVHRAKLQLPAFAAGAERRNPRRRARCLLEGHLLRTRHWLKEHLRTRFEISQVPGSMPPASSIPQTDAGPQRLFPGVLPGAFRRVSHVRAFPVPSVPDPIRRTTPAGKLQPRESVSCQSLPTPLRPVKEHQGSES